MDSLDILRAEISMYEPLLWCPAVDKVAPAWLVAYEPVEARDEVYEEEERGAELD